MFELENLLTNEVESMNFDDNVDRIRIADL